MHETAFLFQPEPLLAAEIASTAKSNTRNRIPGTSGTENAVSCIGFRGVVKASEIRDTACVSAGHRIVNAEQDIGHSRC
eukprot:3939948-Rhodomonas_salina.4